AKPCWSGSPISRVAHFAASWRKAPRRVLSLNFGLARRSALLRPRFTPYRSGGRNTIRDRVFLVCWGSRDGETARPQNLTDRVKLSGPAAMLAAGQDAHLKPQRVAQRYHLAEDIAIRYRDVIAHIMGHDGFHRTPEIS